MNQIMNGNVSDELLVGTLAKTKSNQNWVGL